MPNYVWWILGVLFLPAIVLAVKMIAEMVFEMWLWVTDGIYGVCQTLMVRYRQLQQRRR